MLKASIFHSSRRISQARRPMTWLGSVCPGIATHVPNDNLLRLVLAATGSGGATGMNSHLAAARLRASIR